MNNNCIKNIIEPTKVLIINNKLRSLGLNSALFGTKLINKAIQIILSSNNEFYMLEDILDEIINLYPQFNKKQIRNAMTYSLNSRNIQLSKKNFEKIFGYEYDEYIFTTKNFIEELVNILVINEV